jgi:hypothetical protein
MKKLIDDIKNRILEVSAIKYIDEDWGQLDYYSPNAPAKFPCAIVDISQGQFSNEGDLTQRGILSVSIRIADLRISNSNVKAPVSQKLKASAYFDLLSAVHAKLHGWSNDSDNGPLTRILMRKVKRDDGIRETELIYQVQYMDDSAQPIRETTRATIKVKIERL